MAVSHSEGSRGGVCLRGPNSPHPFLPRAPELAGFGLSHMPMQRGNSADVPRWPSEKNCKHNVGNISQSSKQTLMTQTFKK